MGSAHSESKVYQDPTPYGWIQMQVDKKAYHPGELVTGKIFIQTLKPCQDCELVLEFEGKEALYFIETYADRHGRTHERLNSNSRSVLNYKSVICTWESLSVEQLEVPFGFILDKNIPASFHEESSEYSAYIAYKLKVFLTVDLPIKLQFEYSKKIVVRERFETYPKALSTEVLTPLKTWCCIPEGFNVLRVFLEKGCYNSNDTVNAVIELDNSKSQLKNNEITFSLVNILKFRIGCDQITRKFIFAVTTLPGLEPGALKRSNSVTLRVPNFRDADHDLDQRTYHWPQNKYNSDLPSITRGKLITSEVFLEVCCPMEGCYANSPKVMYPIQMIRPDFDVQTEFAISNWSPRIIPNIDFIFGTPKSVQKVNREKNLDTEMAELRIIEGGYPNEFLV